MGEEVRGVIGTNSWGSEPYEKAIRGSYVDDETIARTVDMALSHGLDVFDTADDYGFGYAQRLLGSLRAGRPLEISAKYTPIRRYRYGQVYEAFDRQCSELGVDSIDYYWLHLPNDIERNLVEVADLYQRGKIGHVGVSNFSLREAMLAKEFLDGHDVPLYGVQNHFSLLDREEEASGMLAWCRENHLAFWGWAALEEGILSGNPTGPMGMALQGKARRLGPLFGAMREVGSAHALTTAQVALAYCASKGVVPICGCRKPYQAQQFAMALEANLTSEEVKGLEDTADGCGVKILRTDMFRFAVHGREGHGSVGTMRNASAAIRAAAERSLENPVGAYVMGAVGTGAAAALLHLAGTRRGSTVMKATSLAAGAGAVGLLALAAGEQLGRMAGSRKNAT